ncbi:rod shape-determining protein MreD [Bacillaceae bacterium Marseille-Q3522]|nr:rod shape-determining protein MreD [Bacillaceae bacterium Marseille-Q3522]
MRKFLLPLFLALFFMMESVFVELFSAEAFGSTRIIVPHFLMIALIFLAIYGNNNHGILYAFLFGLLFDVIYTEIIGIYLCFFPLLTYGVVKIMKVLQANIVVVSFISLLAVALLELAVYEIIYLIHRTNMDFSYFSEIRLLPTLIVNTAFIIIVAYPIKKFCENYAKELRKD